jgi:hypothetical protein
MQRKTLYSLLRTSALVAAALGFNSIANAQILIGGSGVVGTHGVSASANISTSGSNLLLQLCNTTAGGTLARSDVLTGVYMAFNGTTPSLTFLDGRGDTYAATTTSTLTTNVSLVGDSGSNSGKFQLKSFPSFVQGGTQYEWGVGTVGNSGLSGAGGSFNGSIVGNDDYTLIAPGTDRSAASVDNVITVKNCATFTFGGYSGHTASEIDHVLFSFGSAPDATIMATTVVAPTPEPGVVALAAGIGSFGLLALRRRYMLRKAR